MSSNGYFSFGSEEPATFMAAPFWANADISNRIGTVSYEVHHSDISQTYISQVSMFISQQQQVTFNGTWMLISEWSNVPQYGGLISHVSKRIHSNYLSICS